MHNDRILPPAGLPSVPVQPQPFAAVQGGYPQGPAGDDEISLRDVWYLLVRNRWLILGSFTVALVGSITYAQRTVPVYQASTSIRIDEPGGKLPVLDILKDAGGSELATEMEVLKSRSLARTVADSLSIQVEVVEPRSARRNELLSVLDVAKAAPDSQYVLERFGVGFKVAGGSGAVVASGERLSVGGSDIVLQAAALEEQRIVLRLRPFESAVARLGRQLSVSRPSRDANVVIVRYQGTDPAMVRDVPNVLAQNFILRRNAVKKTEARSTVLFLRQQIDTLTSQLAESEDSLRAFRESAAVVSLPDEASSQVHRLAELQAERAAIDAERSALAALLRDVTAAAAVAKVEDPSPYRRLLAFPTLLRNGGMSQLLGTMNQIENERSELLVRRTAKDPDVITVTVRIREMEEQIRQLATTYLQGLTNQVASIDAELAKFTVQLQQVPEKEIAYARLMRRPKVLEDVYTMLQARLKEAEIIQAVEDPSVRVVDEAVMPTAPIRPNKPIIVLMGGMLGLMTGLGGAFLRKSFDHKVRSRDDVLRITGLQVLGIIPRIESAVERKQLPGGSLLRRLAFSTPSGNGAEAGRLVPVPAGEDPTPVFASRLITGNDPRNPISEAYRSLRTTITFARLDSAPRTLVFTSAMPGDGKSTTASNLAITLAQQGLRVLLVDADLRRGVLNDVFHMRRDPGLSNLILGIVEPSAAIRTVPLGDDLTIDFLPTGSLPPNPAELVGSQRMRALLATLEERYDAVILDAPPLNVVTDAALLGTKADGVLVVTRAAKNTVHELEYAMMQLANVRAPVLGMVLNDVDLKGAARYGYGGYGAYQYYYTETA